MGCLIGCQSHQWTVKCPCNTSLARVLASHSNNIGRERCSANPQVGIHEAKKQGSGNTLKGWSVDYRGQSD